jgi:hypothetical protein
MSAAMRKASLTVGDLISELCRWPDHAVVKFRSPLQELQFDHIEGDTRGIVEIDLASAPKSGPVVAA